MTLTKMPAATKMHKEDSCWGSGGHRPNGGKPLDKHGELVEDQLLFGDFLGSDILCLDTEPRLEQNHVFFQSIIQVHQSDVCLQGDVFIQVQDIGRKINCLWPTGQFLLKSGPLVSQPATVVRLNGN